MSDEFDYQFSSANFADSAEDLVAVVTSVSPLEVLFRGQTVGAVNGNANQPLTVGDPVRVTRYAQQLVVASNMAAYPTIGVVSAFAAGGANCTVIAGDDTFDAQTVGTYTPVVGDRVVLFWMANQAGNAQCFAAKRGAAVSSPANPPAAPDQMNATSGPDLPTPPPPVTGPQTVTLYAQQTGSYLNATSLYTTGNARYWPHTGYTNSTESDWVDAFWFYGDQTSKIRGVTVTKTEIWLQRMSGVGPSTGQDFTITLHKLKTRPNTLPLTVSYDIALENFCTLKAGQSGWFTIPNSPNNWGQLIANGTWSGVAAVTWNAGEPLKALIGIDYPNDATRRNVQSGALRITYKRS